MSLAVDVYWNNELVTIELLTKCCEASADDFLDENTLTVVCTQCQKDVFEELGYERQFAGVRSGNAQHTQWDPHVVPMLEEWLVNTSTCDLLESIPRAQNLLASVDELTESERLFTFAMRYTADGGGAWRLAP